MVLFMHVMLFFMCINLALGFTAIPNTPLSINDATLGTAYTCYTESIDYLVVWDATASSGDPSNPGAWVPAANVTGGSSSAATNQISNFDDYINDFKGSSDPITEALEIGYNTADMAVDILTGGFIANTIASISMTCDWSGTPFATNDLGVANDNYNPNFGTPVSNEVVQYFIVAIQVLFGFMVFLAVIYLFTGKSFGL